MNYFAQPIPETYPGLVDLLPPVAEPENIGGRYGFKQTICVYRLHDRSDFREESAYKWNLLYEMYVRFVAKKVFGCKDWLTFKATPVARENYAAVDAQIELILYVDIIVASTERIVIPEFVWETDAVTGKNHIVEWRCGYCKSPNVIESRHCTQCGSPRAQLAQEISGHI